MVNTICIYNTGNFHIMGIFFVAFIGADYNRCSWIYKITRFNGNGGAGTGGRSQKGGYQNRLSKNVRYSVHNVNACFNTFSFSFKLLLGENTFLWNISKRLLRVDILQKSYSENFLKIHQKTPLKLEESLFNYVADSILEILQKCNLN